MRGKITALLFDFTGNNLYAHEAAKVSMTSGKNVLKDLIQFEDGEFSESPFVQLIEIACDQPYNSIRDEQISTILGIDKNNLCFYQIYTYYFKNNISFTRDLSIGDVGKPIILANKAMLEVANPIFEIRSKINEKWSSWQAITGRFIVAQKHRGVKAGVKGIYSPMTERDIESFKQNFQLRYSGSRILELGKPNALLRIKNDPSNSDIRKVIDPKTFQILFDSQIIQAVSSDESYELWRKFEERYG